MIAHRSFSSAGHRATFISGNHRSAEPDWGQGAASINAIDSTRTGTTAIQSVERIVDQMDAISLSEMGRVALLNRVDTKYMLNLQQLSHVLTHVTDFYDVLTIDDTRLQSYQTRYFDTANFHLYLQHHNGKRNRHKVRMRRYENSDLCFLEIKFKSNQGRTIKNRIQIPQLSDRFDGETESFMAGHSPYRPTQLEPKVVNRFLRITLANKKSVERLTIDLALEFSRTEESERHTMPALALVEVKQARFSAQSEFIQQMRAFDLNIIPTSFSKYCIGSALVYPHLKSNNFKRILLMVEKLSRWKEQKAYAHSL